MNTPTSSPIPDAGLVQRLQHSEIFREYQQAFQIATGLPLLLRGVGDLRVQAAGTRNITPFCAVLARKSKTCAACLEIQAHAEAMTTTEPSTLQCFAGLYDSLVPIRMGEHLVAYLQTGQVLFAPPTEAQFDGALKQLLLLDPALDGQELRAAFFQTRVLSRDHYDAMLRLLTSFARHLSLVANELMIAGATAEPAPVGRARAFISDNLAEDLSLDQVARVAGTSPFYFCKLFKAATGLTFTDYVARARVEHTKRLLRDAQVRISEAAFAVGFQSLSQFNRVFRRVTGESPTDYRANLAA